MVSGKSKGRLAPCDQHRKDQRKKEIKRNKKERAAKRESTWVNRDSDAIKAKIDDLQDMENRGALDVPGKQRMKALDDTYKAVMRAKKAHGERKAEQAAIQEKNPNKNVKVIGLSLITGRNPEKEQKQKEQAAIQAANQYGYDRPEDSPYYHPTLNPYGAPPANAPLSLMGGPAIVIPESKTKPAASRQPPGPPPGAAPAANLVAGGPGAPPGPPPGAPPGPPPGGPPGPPPGGPPGAPPGPPPGAPPGPPPGGPPGAPAGPPPGPPPGPPVMIPLGMPMPRAPPGPPPGAPPGPPGPPSGGPPRGPPGPPPGAPPGPPPGGPPGAPPGPPPGGPPGPPRGAPPERSLNHMEEDDDEGEGVGALGLLGAYADDDDEAKPQQHYMNPARMAQMHSAPAVSRAPQVTAAPQIKSRGPTGGNAQTLGIHRAPQIEKKSLSEVSIDRDMVRMVPGAVQRRKLAPKGPVRRKPGAFGEMARPGAGLAKPGAQTKPTLAAPMVVNSAPPVSKEDADDPFASFMDEINDM